MKPILYRVETYIVPEINKEQELSLEAAINGIDDLKIANRLNVQQDENVPENNAQSKENASSSTLNNNFMESKKCCVDVNKRIKRKMIKDITNKSDAFLSYRQVENNNIIYHNDEDSDEHLYVQKEFQSSVDPQDAFYPVRQFKKFNSLVSIDEGSEHLLEPKVGNFCHHGFKNGCTATIPSPEEVSDEIFKDNWLHKMDILRQRDADLKEREMNLQRKERELFLREKELRITERTLSNKLKLLDQQLKYQKEMLLVEKRLEEAAQALSHEELDTVKIEKSKDHQPPEKTPTLRRSASTPEKIMNQAWEKNPKESEESENRKIRYSTRPKNYQTKQPCSSNATARTLSYAGTKYKEQPPSKIRFDDLNSTLSAATVDSSFVQTSRLFNPLLYRKPQAFTRSASERYTSKKANAVVTRLQAAVNVEEKPTEPTIEEEKILQKLSENIQASQNKETRFQNYGLVDCVLDDQVQQSDAKPNVNPGNEKKKFSYLDLAISSKHDIQKTRPNVSKDHRPISWNAEEDEWLQKKRLAYNLAIKNSAETKEDNKCNKVTDKVRNKSSNKAGKSSKKAGKSSKKAGKIFTIFR